MSSTEQHVPVQVVRPQLIRSHSDKARQSARSIFAEDLSQPTHAENYPLRTSKRPSTANAAAPERPPRNPARSASTSVSAPGPPDFTSAPKPAPRKTPRVQAGAITGPREEVTPWELLPGPAAESPEPSKNVEHSNSTSTIDIRSSHRPTSSSGSALHGRRLKPPEPKKHLRTRANRSPHSLLYGSDIAPFLLSLNTSTTVAPPTSASTKPLSPKKIVWPTNMKQIHILGHGQESSQIVKTPSAESKADSKFSTADRTILEELRRNISAREAQFVLKSSGSSKFGASPFSVGKRHHPYPKEEAPYPRSYERDVLDLDAWETLFTQQLSGSLTFNVFETPPARVLDIGCGTGTWVLECSRAWRNSHFVGLDIVPLHPDLQQVGSAGLASRITWIQANFLEGLPFPNEEFDFVHIKRIGLGVPEDKWDTLFEEITRIMKPGGAIEVIEEDLVFPGKMPEVEDQEEEDVPFNSNRTQSDPDNDTDSVSTNGRRSSVSLSPRKSNETMRSMSSVNTSPLLTGAVPSGLAALSVPEEEPLLDHTPLRRNIHDIQGSHHRSRSQSPSTVRQEPPRPKILDLKSHPQSSDLHSHTTTKRNSTFPLPFQLHGTAAGTIMPPTLPWMTSSPRISSSLSIPLDSASQTMPSPSRTLEPLPQSSPLLRPASVLLPSSQATELRPRNERTTSAPKPPPNPRDHSVLEAVYNGMLESRFINTSPISLLENSMGLYFKDVRSHPTLQMNFPPLPSSLPLLASEESTDDSDPDDDARDAIVESPTHHRTPLPNQDGGYWLSVGNLIRGGSPYVSLDENKTSAISPSRRVSMSALHTLDTLPDPSVSEVPNPPGADKLFPGGQRVALMSTGRNRLPNKTLNIDLQNLNLHLAARVTEILGCAETMWEWVLEYQGRVKAKGVRAIPLDNEGDVIMEEIAQLSRDEFDRLLSNFDIDMRDNMALGQVLEDRFGWSGGCPGTSAERKNFENEFRQWTKWNEENNRQQPEVKPTRAVDSASTSPFLKPIPGLPSSSQQLFDLPSLGLSSSSSNISHSLLSRPRQQRREPNTGGPSPTPPRMNRSFRVFVGWKADDD